MAAATPQRGPRHVARCACEQRADSRFPAARMPPASRPRRTAFLECSEGMREGSGSMSSVSADPSATGSLDGLAAVFAHRIVAALPLNWAQRVSMHDARGQVCWQSAGVWGPADLDAVRLALERFVGNCAPARADHELPEQRTAVLLRAADTANVFRGFVMLVMDNRRLRGKGKAVNDLPVPVQRAAHEWAMRLAAAPTVYPHVDAATAELTATQAERLIAFGPTIEEPEVEKFFARLRAFPLALVAQSLAPLQRGMRIRRYEVFLREAA